jgi:hypothetical protein
MYVHFHYLNYIKKWKECDRETERQKKTARKSERDNLVLLVSSKVTMKR